MTLESACIPIPSEAVMPYGGYLAHQHVVGFWQVVLAGTLANLVGGWIAYFVGYTGGRPFILRYGKYVLLSERHLVKSEEWFQKYGEWTVLLARVLPAFRTVISLPAGIAKMPFMKFTFFSLVGSFVWNYFLTEVGVKLGENWDNINHYIKPITYVGVLVIVVILVWFVRSQRKANQKNSSGV